MQEIADIERLARGLSACWLGAKVTAVLDRQPDALADHLRDFHARDVRIRLVGTVVREVRRTGKVILMHLANGPNPTKWFVLEWMPQATGWFYPVNRSAIRAARGHNMWQPTRGEPLVTSDRVAFCFGNGQEWAYRDQRRWGQVSLYTRLDITSGRSPVLAGYGPDWLHQSSQARAALLAHSPRGQFKARVKEVLLRQDVAAGLGSCTVGEACHLAGMHPHTLWHGVTAARRADLADAVEHVVRRALAAPDMSHMRVFQRAGDWCFNPVCAGVIETVRDWSYDPKTSYFCPACQKLPAILVDDLI